MRFLAIDLGDKRTGLALGDSQTRLVTPLEVLEVPLATREGAALLEAIGRAVESQLGAPRPGATGGLVLGLPLNMDGTEGPRAKLVRAFADRLKARSGWPVHMQDERLTSADAEWQLSGSGLTRGQKKQRRDALAAAAILRDFLNSSSGMASEREPA